MDVLYSMIVAYTGKVLLALFVLALGLKVINKSVTLASGRIEKAELDDSIKTFTIPMIKIVLQILLVITVASMLGAEITSFVAIIGAASFAIGLALQGSLANFAGGILILTLKPFK